MNDRLYRSVDDRVIAGVCGGLALRMGLDPSLVRIGYALVALLTGIFPFVVLYVLMVVVVPEEPTGFAGFGPSPTPPGPGAIPGWAPPGATLEAGPPTGTAPEGWTAAPTGWPRHERRHRRDGDPVPAVIGGLVLVALGAWFLVRDRLQVDWGVVWAAGLVALGVVVLLAAFRPRR